jgi:Xaa-Pro aminopeptidase
LDPIPPYQSDFTAEELRSRRTRLALAIGEPAVAVVPGLGELASMGLFRQSNEFYYLTGLEVPRAYLTVEGGSGRSVLYLTHRDLDRERSEGIAMSVEHADLLRNLVGVDEVKPAEALAPDLAVRTYRPPRPRVFVPMAPAEGAAQSRIEMTAAAARAISDPWDGGHVREKHLVSELRRRFPELDVEDLSPHLDRMRLVKSVREQELLREAGRLTADAAAEAMRSTAPGVTEYELAAVALLKFLLSGARGEAYRAIVATGTNAWHGHYFQLASPLHDGELVLYDYAPDFRYYTSDIGRMWPVSGTFSRAQRALYGYIVEYHQALLRLIKPGAFPKNILDAAAEEMRPVLERATFAEPYQARAARTTLEFRGHLSHPVGMAVHDVGEYRAGELEPGMVISVDPMFWIPEDRLYIRCEDTVLVTDDGVEVLTSGAPLGPDATEQMMRETGILQSLRG